MCPQDSCPLWGRLGSGSAGSCEDFKKEVNKRINDEDDELINPKGFQLLLVHLLSTLSRTLKLWFQGPGSAGSASLLWAGVALSETSEQRALWAVVLFEVFPASPLFTEDGSSCFSAAIR